MWELVAKPVLEGAFGACKELFRRRIDQWNTSRLAKKREEAKASATKVPADVLSRLALTKEEQSSGNVSFEIPAAYELLDRHVAAIREWSSAISFSDLSGGTKRLDEIYVELDTYVTPTRLHFSDKERSQTLPLEEAIFRKAHHCVILGQPGAGKTTSMKRACAKLLSRKEGDQSFSDCSFPLLIKFRDLGEGASKRSIIISELQRIFPLQFQFSGPLDREIESEAATKCREESFLQFVDYLKPFIILEGFDEYPNNTEKDHLAAEIRRIIESLSSSKVIVTCRAGEFGYNINNCRTFEIATLSRPQIETFVSRWIPEKDAADKFIKDLYASPFADTAIKPLSIAHLCAIYERIGQIPDKPKSVYRKIVSLLLEDWDHQRGIKRGSKYSTFLPDRKFDFLTHLSYYLTTTTRRSVFTKDDFLLAYKNIHKNFNLDKLEAQLVVSEIESHTGLFLQSGYDKFEFAHKSIQEYLAAEYIVKLPAIPRDSGVIRDLGAELAIAVGISSNSSLYLSDLILNVAQKQDLSPAFYDSLISRLLLEKPDFYEDKTVVIAFFTLLSLWINNGRSLNFASYRKDITAEDKSRYIRLLSNITERNSAQTIAGYFEVKRPVAARDDIVQIRRNGTLNGFVVPPLLLIPKDLMEQYLPVWRKLTPGL